MIDAGVEGIIGSHSHLTHDVEIYKGKIIAYCLGNFYLPSGIYFGGKLKYHEESKKTIGIRVRNNQIDVLRFETDKTEPICFLDAIKPTEFSSFQISDINEYVKIFKKRRTKRLLVPVFKNYSGAGYSTKRLWSIQRVKVIKQLSKFIHR